MKIYTILLIFFFNSTCAHSNIVSPEIKTQIDNPQIIGKTTLKYFLFKLYDISLWGEKEKFSYDQKLAIYIEYNMNFDKDELIETSVEEIARINNLKEENLGNYKTKLQQIFVDVKKGDTKTAIFDPKNGLKLFHNNKLKGQIKDLIFAKRFIDIWLNKNTRFKTARNKLVNYE